MQAYKVNAIVSKDRRLAIRLPDDFPSGPAEVIVLALSMETSEAQAGSVEAFEELRNLHPTEGEAKDLEEVDREAALRSIALRNAVGRIREDR